MWLRLALGTSQGGNDPLWRPGKLHSALWAEEVVGLCLSGNLLFGPRFAYVSDQRGWDRDHSLQ